METKTFVRSWASPMMLTHVGRDRKPMYEKVYIWSNGEDAYLGGFYEKEGRVAFDPAALIFFTEHKVRGAARQQAFATGREVGVKVSSYSGEAVGERLNGKGMTLVEYIFHMADACDLPQEKATTLIAQLLRGYGLQG